MNGGRAKFFRRLANQTLAFQQKDNTDLTSDLALGKTVYIEDTNRRKTQLVPGTELDPETGELKKVHVTVAIGTISILPSCKRGIYRKIKKLSKQPETRMLFKQNIQHVSHL